MFHMDFFIAETKKCFAFLLEYGFSGPNVEIISKNLGLVRISYVKKHIGIEIILDTKDKDIYISIGLLDQNGSLHVGYFSTDKNEREIKVSEPLLLYLINFHKHQPVKIKVNKKYDRYYFSEEEITEILTRKSELLKQYIDKIPDSPDLFVKK